MAISSLKQIVENCYESGQYWQQYFSKTFPFTTGAAYATDLSLAPGNPRPNYYVGDQWTATRFNGAYGIWHGGDVPAGQKKYIHKVELNSAGTAMYANPFTLCDYLLFYPLVDGESDAEQTFTNTVTLPRYTDGAGVKAFLVATNLYANAVGFQITYTNQNGQSRTSRRMVGNTVGGIGTVYHSGINTSPWNTGLFIPTADPQDGIRSVQSLQFDSPPGGLFALVLCKPIFMVHRAMQNYVGEWDLLTMSGGLKEIQNGAYLNFIMHPWTNAAGQYVRGYITTIWN